MTQDIAHAVSPVAQVITSPPPPAPPPMPPSPMLPPPTPLPAVPPPAEPPPMEFCVAHWPLMHDCPVPHVRQSPPLVPHAAMAPPDWHSPLASQHPVAHVAGPHRRTGGVHDRNAAGNNATRTTRRMELTEIPQERPATHAVPSNRGHVQGVRRFRDPATFSAAAGQRQTPGAATTERAPEDPCSTMRSRALSVLVRASATSSTKVPGE